MQPIEPDVFVALPVYQGSEVIAETLRSIRDQTYTRYRVLVSIDGDDPASLEACRPFKADRRVSIVVQPQRLGWLRHFNWLFKACDLPFVCYWQQDDLAATNYLETLRAEFLIDPDAAIAYSDVQWFGAMFHRDSTPSIVGSSAERMLECIEAIRYEPLRGLMRTACLPRPDALDPHSDDGCHAEFPFLAAMAAQGSLRRCERTLYYKRSHDSNTYLRWRGWTEERRRRSWIDMGLGFLAVAQRVLSAPEQFPQALALILDRLAIQRNGRGFFYQLPEESWPQVESFVRDFLGRGRIELPTLEADGQTPFCRPIHPHLTQALKKFAGAIAERNRLVQRLHRTGSLSIAVNSSDPEGALLLGDGWSLLEDWGVWSNASQASLRLPLPAGGRWKIRLDLRHFVVPGVANARITWTSSPHQTPQLATIPAGTILPLELTIEAAGPLTTLDLAFPDAVFLPDVDIPDPRFIAVGLSRVTICRET